MNIEGEKSRGVLHRLLLLSAKLISAPYWPRWRPRRNRLEEMNVHQLRDLGLQAHAPPFDQDEHLMQAKLKASLLLTGLNGK
ncbi:hypothetical protein [Allorhizobium undicola]|uniref:hypothetical protein n=1 Tax=Allorhizobium undicola TaxID=78527 RepID=UPI0012B535D4|nr:hypothetical protein [Allorhizobium undicola]